MQKERTRNIDFALAANVYGMHSWVTTCFAFGAAVVIVDVVRD